MNKKVKFIPKYKIKISFCEADFIHSARSMSKSYDENIIK